MNRNALTAAALATFTGLTSTAYAQSFGLDDNPAAPLIGFPGALPGFGAEDPYGDPWVGAFAALFPPGMAPSPSLSTIAGVVTGGGDVFGPGPALQQVGPNGNYMSSFSQNTPFSPNIPVRIMFSVDRGTRGAFSSDVGTQAFNLQAPADIYQTTSVYMSPNVFTGAIGPGPFAGFLPSFLFGPPFNALLHDDSFFGLLSGGVVVPAAGTAAPYATGSHDNIDSWENKRMAFPGTVGFIDWMYFTIYPDEAIAAGVAPADIFDLPPSTPGATPVPYATAASMGLDFFGGPNSDAIDALTVYDMAPFGGPAWGGPGAQPGFDAALFSLAPGSASLAALGLDPGTIFFTDFTGAFAVYAETQGIGLVPSPGAPNGGDNVDAMDVACVFDVNGDGFVDGGDLAAVLSSWGSTGFSLADFNGDGIVNGADLAVMLGSWGPCL